MCTICPIWSARGKRCPLRDTAAAKAARASIRPPLWQKRDKRSALPGAIGEDGLFLKAYLDGLGIDTADLAVLDMPTATP